MCRNIRPLNNFEPPATGAEIEAAALQFVRKVAGTTKPSAANQEVFDKAVAEIAHITEHLVGDLNHRERIERGLAVGRDGEDIDVVYRSVRGRGALRPPRLRAGG